MLWCQCMGPCLGAGVVEGSAHHADSGSARAHADLEDDAWRGDDEADAVAAVPMQHVSRLSMADSPNVA